VYHSVTSPCHRSIEISPSAGSITRGRLEKSEPSISYEAFVEDLDGGDSFTTSLVDVLVKVVCSLANNLGLRS
jgi:hypothetical protein